MAGRSTPFAGLVKDGRVYGRGACDMKGGMAASIIAVDAFMAVYPRFPRRHRDLGGGGTVDEGESGGFGGVAYLGEAGVFLKTPASTTSIIPEPLNKDRICLGPSRRLVGGDRDQGEIAHGSIAVPLANCAVRHMGAVMHAFEEELFPPARQQADRGCRWCLRGARRSTMNINSVHGGQTEDYRPGLPSPNVPDSCRMTIDRRFLLEESLDEVKNEVVSILDRLTRDRDKFRYDIRDVMEVLRP